MPASECHKDRKRGCATLYWLNSLVDHSPINSDIQNGLKMHCMMMEILMALLAES